ncbi:MAG: GspE/PulE/PilB domain-containing protein, partial [Planctomycetota bacterium]
MSDQGGKGGRRLLGQVLKRRGAVQESDIQEALEAQRKQGGLIGQHLVALGVCSLDDVTQALAEQAGLEAVDVTGFQPGDDALGAVDSTTAHAYGILPLSLRGDVLEVALADPLNTAVLEDLSFSTGHQVVGRLAESQALRTRITELYGEEQSLAQAIDAAATSGVGDD